MSVEALRRAAALMREDPDDRWHSVADLLTEAAHRADEGYGPYAPTLAVARAYLGEAPTVHREG